MDKIRIPAKYLELILKEMISNPEKESWTFISDLGNVLVCNKIKTNTQTECIDFQYNPDD